MERELRLEDLLIILKKNLLIIIIIMLLTGAGGYYIADYVMVKKYQSTALLYVQNTTAAESTTLNINDINAAQKLVNTCQIIFRSETMMEMIISELQLNYTVEELQKMILTQSVNNTEVMRITVTSENPDESAQIVNTMLMFANEEYQRIIKTGDFTIVDYGKVNIKPSFPSLPLFTAAGLILGFVLVYIIAFLAEIFNIKIKCDDDLTKVYGIPQFAEIPDLEYRSNKKAKYYNSQPKPKVKRGKNNYLLSETSAFSITEAYNTGRTNIMFSLAPYERKIVVFTSCNPSEGKSLISVNMSISFAKAGFKILLIDCDMRRPIIGNYFDLKNRNGLSTILGGFCNIDDAINENVKPKLDVIAAGEIPPNPSELLTSTAMLELLEYAKNEYDFVFLDTPPINVVSDSQLMNDLITGIVFVVKEYSTTHPDLRKAIENMTMAKGKTLGFIRNFTNSSKRGRRYGYKKNYAYKTKKSKK